MSAFFLWSAATTAAFAACPTLTTLQNGTTADATVVMSNFNSIRDCVNGLTSGTSLLYGSGSGGFSNATVSSPLSFSAGALSLGTVPMSKGGTGSTTIATGAVVFSSGTNLTGNANSFFWDNTNSRLGIGLAGVAPASSLAVGGGASIGADYNVAPPLNGLIVEGQTYIGSAAPAVAGRLVVTGTPGNAFVVVDNFGNQIFTVKTNGSVGIGSAGAINDPLDVYSTLAGSTPSTVTISNTSTDSAAGQKLLLQSAGGGDVYEVFQNTGSSYTWSVGIDASDAGKFKISSSNKPGGQDRFTVQSTGEVGVGTTAPAYPLDVTGDIRTSQCLHYNGGSIGTCASDARLKRDIAPYTALGLSEIVALVPKTFLYNGKGGNPDDGVRQIGLMAQDVEKSVPSLIGEQLVRLSPNDRASTPVKTVNYGALTFGLINAVKELKAANDRSAAEIRELKSQVLALNAKIKNGPQTNRGRVRASE